MNLMNRPAPRSLLANIALGCIVMSLATGCNSESETNSTTVSPPPMSSEIETTPADPPGELEMPTDVQPTTTPADASVSPGIEMPTTASEKSAEESNASVEIQFATWQEVEQAAKSSGKITVVDIWSTVCVPCVTELPHLAELHQSMKDQVQCIAMSIDFDGRKSKPAESYQESVLAVLNFIRADFPCYISTTASDDVYAAAEIDSIPAVLIYDADGKLIKKFVDTGDSVGFTYHKDIIPYVKELTQR
ncbi:MAG: TlpA family protein disulfide reductase [Pirellulaceae bacterium]|nr:TlpA family protein disulfide reductase [Pirellulaceae bacterium]